ncbi:MAG: filamentous hemagglutinin N-terminal domain-containing protein [Phormidesmis sp.]
MNSSRRTLAFALVLGSLGALCPTSAIIAQNNIIPDDTLGAESSQVNGLDATTDLIEGGALRDTTLFHSFQELNVAEGLAVYFNNPTNVDNIFSRVTGVNSSNILGTLGVRGAANLFLINPNGILFGPEADLDIQGSFLATTASTINRNGNNIFPPSSQDDSPLLVSVPMGLQYGPSSSTATIDNSGLLSAGQDLTFIAGQINSSGLLLANNNIRLSANNIDLSNSIDSSAPSDEGTAFDLLESGVASGRAGNDGTIEISATNLSVKDGAQLLTQSGGGDIVLDIVETARFDGVGRSSDILSGAFSELPSGETGTAGNISVNAATVEVLNGAQLASISAGTGDSGNVLIN